MKTLLYCVLLLFALSLSSAGNVMADAPGIELKGHTLSVTSVAYSPDGKKIATASVDKTVRIWDATSGKELFRLELGFRPEHVQFTPDGKKFVTVQYMQHNPGIQNVQIWDTDSDSVNFGKELRKQTLREVLCISSDLKKIVARYSDSDSDSKQSGIQVWDVDSGRLLTLPLKGGEPDWEFFGWHGGGMTVISPDGTKVVTARVDNQKSIVLVWDTDSESATFGKELKTLNWETSESQSDQPNDVGFAMAAVFSPDGSKIATIHFESVLVWDVQSGKVIQRLEGHGGDFLPEGKRFATASLKGGTTLIYDVNTGKTTTTIEGARRVLIAPEGKKMAMVTYRADESAVVRVFDTDSGSAVFEKELRKLESLPEFSPDGRKIVIASDEGMAFGIFDADSGKKLQEWEGWLFGFSPDSKNIVAGNDNGTVRVWNLPATPTLTPQTGN